MQRKTFIKNTLQQLFGPFPLYAKFLDIRLSLFHMFVQRLNFERQSLSELESLETQNERSAETSGKTSKKTTSHCIWQKCRQRRSSKTNQSLESNFLKASNVGRRGREFALNFVHCLRKRTIWRRSWSRSRRWRSETWSERRKNSNSYTAASSVFVVYG